MKKRLLAIVIVLSLTVALTPAFSRAAVVPYYFMAYNDTLMPFIIDTMPYISGGEILVPVKVLENLGVFSFSSTESGFARLYKGVSRYVDFYTVSGVTEDQNGNRLNWPSAQRVSRRLYVPLRQICDYFSLTYEIIDVPSEIIPNEQMWLIRIISSASLNGPTFVSLNKNALRKEYNSYYTPLTPAPPPTIGPTPTPTPVIEPPPDYSAVTIYLSFFDVSENSLGGILDLLDIQTTSGYQSCFFVSADDIRNNPGIIRKISGSGHTVGILLKKGTLDEYLEASALLFEAAKIKTVLISADVSILTDMTMVIKNGLIFWESTQSFIDHEAQLLESITASFPQERNARQNLMFSCSETAASILPGIISYLREKNYTIEKITETVAPTHSVR